jgi:hypothetical protein
LPCGAIATSGRGMQQHVQKLQQRPAGSMAQNLEKVGRGLQPMLPNKYWYQRPAKTRVYKVLRQCVGLRTAPR